MLFSTPSSIRKLRKTQPLNTQLTACIRTYSCIHINCYKTTLDVGTILLRRTQGSSFPPFFPCRTSDSNFIIQLITFSSQTHGAYSFQLSSATLSGYSIGIARATQLIQAFRSSVSVVSNRLRFKLCLMSLFDN